MNIQTHTVLAFLLFLHEYTDTVLAFLLFLREYTDTCSFGIPVIPA